MMRGSSLPVMRPLSSIADNMPTPLGDCSSPTESTLYPRRCSRNAGISTIGGMRQKTVQRDQQQS